MKIVNYPDGSSYAEISKNVRSFTYKINSYDDLWKLGQILEAYNYNNVEPIVTIPNLIDAQADKRFDTLQSSGLSVVCSFLNAFNAYYKIFHPHNPEVLEALLNRVTIINNHKFIVNVFYEICNNDKERYPSILIDEYDKTSLGYHYNSRIKDNLILMSTDAGGFKPLMKLCDELSWKGDVMSASKSREYKDGEVKLTQLISQSDFGGKDILLVDDLCIYGGTFKGLAKLLRERNCGKLYLAVSHMTVQNLGNDPVTNYFDQIFTTNSKFDDYFSNINFHPDNLNVLKMF